MNKKILSIIFTLFLAGLLSISCSNKDKTGPSGDEGNNGGGSTSGLPTPTTDGEGVGSSYRQYKYAPSSASPFVLTPSEGEAINLTSESDFQLSTSSKDANLQGKYKGGILIKMPLLTQLGFKSDLIRILPENIASAVYGHNIHTLYVLNNTEEKLEYVELKVTDLLLGTFIEINRNGSITLTKTTKEKDKNAVTVTYTLTFERTKNVQSANSVTPISGTPIDPSYK